MKNKGFVLFLIIFILVNIGIIFSVLGGKLTFGYGLGDLADLGGFAFFFLLIAILGFFSRKSKEARIIMILAVSVFYVVYFLKLTYFRGIEHPWNGHVFFY